MTFIFELQTRLIYDLQKELSKLTAILSCSSITRKKILQRSGKCSNNSAAVDLNFQAVFYVFMSPVTNIESSSVTGSSLKRQNTENIYSYFYINARSDCAQSDTNLFIPTCP